MQAACAQSPYKSKEDRGVGTMIQVMAHCYATTVILDWTLVQDEVAHSLSLQMQFFMFNGLHSPFQLNATASLA